MSALPHPPPPVAVALPPHRRPNLPSVEDILSRAVDKSPVDDSSSGGGTATTTFDYDLIVIGGGSGGLATAKEAKQLGANVALIDFVAPSTQGTTWGLGGTCVNVGCIPKKLFHTAALHGEHIRHHAQHFGWEMPVDPQWKPELEPPREDDGLEHFPPPDCKLNWTRLRNNIDLYIRSLNGGYAAELRKRKIPYINALAKFVDPHTIDCTTKAGKVTRMTARRFVLATGGRPNIPDNIPGAVQHCISSDDVFRMKTAPGKTLCVGASYIALECAGYLTSLGFPTTVMMRSIPLRGFDQDMAQRVVHYMEKHTGTRFLRGAAPIEVKKRESDGKLICVFEVTTSAGEAGGGAQEVKEKREEEFDTILFATGRRPETLGLNLEAARVVLSPKSGKVVVDIFERTSTPHIYAIGDMIEGGLELTPVAIKAGRLLARRLYGQGSGLMDYCSVPTTVFTPLEYGSVGLSEENANERYGMTETYHTYFSPLEWSLPHVEHNICYMKLIVNPFDHDRVLGFHILSPNAGEIVQAVAVALKANATKADFDETIGIHPTLAEDMTMLKITKSSGVEPTKTGC